MLEPQIFIVSVIFLWLIICTGFDLEVKEIPNWITIMPLAISLGFGIFMGYWSQIIFTIYLIVISDIPKELRLPCGFIGLILGISFNPEHAFLFLSYFLFWSLWSIEVLGGADVKIMMTLFLITQSHSLGMYVLIAGGAIGLIYLIRKQTIFPYTLAITAGTCSYYLFHAR